MVLVVLIVVLSLAAAGEGLPVVMAQPDLLTIILVEVAALMAAAAGVVIPTEAVQAAAAQSA
jgi:hypothetical protein